MDRWVGKETRKREGRIQRNIKGHEEKKKKNKGRKGGWI